jgi:outer membrane protein TolC
LCAEENQEQRLAAGEGVCGFRLRNKETSKRGPAALVHFFANALMNSWRNKCPLLPVVLLSAAVAGCSAKFHRESADTEVRKVIQGKISAVPGVGSDFEIERTNSLSLGGFPMAAAAPEFLGTNAQREAAARVLSLERALDLAIKHNRVHQTRREQLYTAALTLTLARHKFTPVFSSEGRARAIGEAKRRTHDIIDGTTGTKRNVPGDGFAEDRHVSADGGVDLGWLWRDVGIVTMAFTTDFLRYLTGDPRAAASSAVNATFIRPLLRNAGFQQQIEALTQAERDLLYDLRAFAQHRKTFSVQVAGAYYGVLGSRDTVRNNHLNLLSSRKNAERTRELAREGRVTQSDLGRLEQQELSAESAWNNALRSYQQALDNFKLLHLGVPVDTNLILDDRELEALKIQHPNLDPDDAVAVALAARPDHQNALDACDDAARKVKVAAEALKPQVDLVAAASFGSGSKSRGFPLPDPERYNWSAGLDVDLPLDRKAERNAYRTAIITEQATRRAAEKNADDIRLEVRDGWRALDQARRNYEISELGVKLAERRVEEQSLLAELGRAKAQDQVDAQNDLISSKNQRTQALVTHTITRLQFWADMGILRIAEDGRWNELKDTDVRSTR